MFDLIAITSNIRRDLQLCSNFSFRQSNLDRCETSVKLKNKWLFLESLGT